MFEKRIEDQPVIKEIQAKLQNLENYRKSCEDTHQSHSKRGTEHDNLYNQHEQLLKTVINTQNSMVKSMHASSQSLEVLSSFVKKHEPVLELLISVITGMKGFNKLILTMAAIITSLGIIMGAGVAIWSVFNTPIIDLLLSIQG